MYCGIYARVSTDLQTENTSLDEQIRLCLNKAYELGYQDHQIRIYKEEGASASDIDIRPEMTRLREDAKQGLIADFICTHPDRLSRDSGDRYIVCGEFDRNSVKLHFTDVKFNESGESKLLFAILAAIAEYELALIRKRTIRGRLQAVENRHKIMPMRVAPYGYNLIDGSLVINDIEARYVRNIYEWYVKDGFTMREIGNKLYENGAKPKRGESKNFGATSIQRILSSEIYIGNYYYNRRETKKIKGQKTAGGNPKKTIKMRDEEDWILVNVPPIISNDLWKLAQEKRKKNLTRTGHVKYEYLLKGMLRCVHCGRTWECTTYSGKEDKNGKRIQYTCYRCPNQFPKRYGEGIEKCKSKAIRTDKLDNYIWNEIVTKIANPEKFIKIMQQDSKSSIEQIELVIESLNKELQMKNKEREKIKNMYLKELISEEEFEKDFARVNREAQSIDNQIIHFTNQIEFNKNKSITADKINEFAHFIHESTNTEKELSFEDKRRVINGLIDGILINYHDSEQVDITYLGALDTLREFNFELSTQLQKDMYVIQSKFTYHSKFKFEKGSHSEKHIVEVSSDI